jgi:SMC interacting uncharacterized protein involved in chromosome segregation
MQKAGVALGRHELGIDTGCWIGQFIGFPVRWWFFGGCAMDGAATMAEIRDTFRSPVRILMPKFLNSRDAWKAKAIDRNDKLKAAQINIRDLSASREMWKNRFEQSNARCGEVQGELERSEAKNAKVQLRLEQSEAKCVELQLRLNQSEAIVSELRDQNDVLQQKLLVASEPSKPSDATIVGELRTQLEQSHRKLAAAEAALKASDDSKKR